MDDAANQRTEPELDALVGTESVRLDEFLVHHRSASGDAYLLKAATAPARLMIFPAARLVRTQSRNCSTLMLAWPVGNTAQS
jgi:hypothetical protein